MRKSVLLLALVIAIILLAWFYQSNLLARLYQPPSENCELAGDEDNNGLADCADVSSCANNFCNSRHTKKCISGSCVLVPLQITRDQNIAKSKPSVSKKWVVWTDDLNKPKGEVEIKAYDIDKRTTQKIGIAHRLVDVRLEGDSVLWRDFGNSTLNVLNLVNGADRKIEIPRHDRWDISQENIAYTNSTSIIVKNINTGETNIIPILGAVAGPSNVAIDGGRVALWKQMVIDKRIYKNGVYLVNLSTKAEKHYYATILDPIGGTFELSGEKVLTENISRRNIYIVDLDTNDTDIKTLINIDTSNQSEIQQDVQITGDSVIWTDTWEIYLCDVNEKIVHKVPTNDRKVFYPRLNDGIVTWISDQNVFIYDMTGTP
jgi:hypothetical protein